MIWCLQSFACVSPVRALPQASSKPREFGWHSNVCADGISAVTFGRQSRSVALC